MLSSNIFFVALCIFLLFLLSLMRNLQKWQKKIDDEIVSSSSIYQHQMMEKKSNKMKSFLLKMFIIPFEFINFKMCFVDIRVNGVATQLCAKVKSRASRLDYFKWNEVEFFQISHTNTHSRHVQRTLNR